MLYRAISKFFSSKIFFIVFSVLISFSLWMYVEINENQIQRHIVPNVPIIRQNAEILEDRGLLISTMSPDTVTLTFECPRSVAARLTNTTLSVAIDLAGVSSRGSTTLPFDPVFPSNVDINTLTLVERSVNRISLYIDMMESRSVAVDVIYRGGAAEGYIQDPLEYSPHTITINGPAEAVSQVGRARVVIERENLASTYTDELQVTLLDLNGEVLADDIRNQLTLRDDTIWVTVPIKVEKEIALTVDLNYRSGATSENTVVRIEPQSIMVAGNPDDIRDFNSIHLGTIDLARFEYSDTEAFRIAIPNNVTPISGESEALVSIDISGLEIRYFSVSNIHIVNVPTGYVPDVRTQSVDVRIRGKAEDMDDLTEANIRVVVSVTDEHLGGRTQRVLARVFVDGIDADVGAVGNNYVTFMLVEDT